MMQTGPRADGSDLLVQHAAIVDRNGPRRVTAIAHCLPAAVSVCRAGDPNSRKIQVAGSCIVFFTTAFAIVLYGCALALAHVSMISLLSLLVVFSASTISSVGGFAFSAICGAVLFHVVAAPIHAVQIMLVSSIAIQAMSVSALRNQLDWHLLGTFVAGGAFGLPFGIYLLLHTSHALYTLLFGGVLIAYGTWMLFRPPLQVGATHWVADVLVGVIGGVTGGVAAFPGAFVTVWCGTKGWDKGRQRGVYQPYILIMQLMTLGLIALNGHTSGGGFDPTVLFYIPAALAGAWLGLSYFHRLSDRQFDLAVNGLLVASGAGLVL